MKEPSAPGTRRAAAHRLGRRLQWATIAWNVGEVGVTVTLGVLANSLALIAFGLDSLVEVFASLVVVWHLGGVDTARETEHDRRALRLVATAFGLLAAYLTANGIRTLWLGVEADASPAGIAYLALTAIVMFLLARVKRKVGDRLASDPFRAEAAMTFLDGWLATGILSALVLNATLGWWWADPLAALLVAVVAAHEAWEHWTSAS